MVKDGIKGDISVLQIKCMKNVKICPNSLLPITTFVICNQYAVNYGNNTRIIPASNNERILS